MDIKENFTKIISVLKEQDWKITKIAHSIGFSTTAQLYNSLDGTSLLSTKAVMGLINNLNVNPNYLFLGQGNMFLNENNDELEVLRRENAELIQKNNEAVKTVVALNESIKKLEAQNSNLIEISTAAINFYKSQGNKNTDNDDEISDLDVYEVLLENDLKKQK